MIHIVDPKVIDEALVVDESQGYIITNPDHLISATDTSSCMPCLRRTFLNNKVDRRDVKASVNPHQVYGSMLHDVFQSCLDGKDFSTAQMNVAAQETINKRSVILHILKITQQEALLHMQNNFFSTFQKWSNMYLACSSNDASGGNNVEYLDGNQETKLLINKMIAIEESVWSPMYGLKGYIDISVEAHVNQSQITRVMPVELKSGKCSVRYNPRGNIQHRAQVLMYLLMMKDKYNDPSINAGVLFYFTDQQTKGVVENRGEMVTIMQSRNLLASCLNESSCVMDRDGQYTLLPKRAQLPPMIDCSSDCARCYSKQTCALYQVAYRQQQQPSNHSGLSPQQLESLCEVVNSSAAHVDYLSKWIECLDLESLESNHYRKELWSMTGPERQAAGRCLSCMSYEYQDQSNGYYWYRMYKHRESPRMNLSAVGIDAGAFVTISSEKGHVAISSGTVTRVDHDNIYLKLKREITMDELLRIDLDEYEISYRQQRGVVLSLFDPLCDDVMRRVRELVVQLQEPLFDHDEYGHVIRDGDHDSRSNRDQKKAIAHVLAARDYALVMGMPGTGKTTTIAAIVRALLLNKRSRILICAHTHTAVDNALLKVLDLGITQIVRVGKVSDVDARLHPYRVMSNIQNETGAIDCQDKLEDLIKNGRVWGSTCLTSDPLLQVDRFDCVIVDEASQISQPECVGALVYGDVFVLVGDPHQLPPLVRSNKARHLGMDVSLFQVLMQAHGEKAMVCLGNQYRMNASIMSLSNHLIYNHQLKCASIGVRDAKLLLDASAPIGVIKWLNDVIDADRCVLFLDTDPLGDASRERKQGMKVVNPCEARVVDLIAKELMRRGVDKQHIGIMSALRSQVCLIQNTMGDDVRVNTIDKFQGLDHHVTIMSLVRSNPSQEINELFKDRSRINVALTRAKQKMILVGSLSTFQSHDPYRSLISFMRDRGWVYGMPSDLNCERNGLNRYQERLVCVVDDYEMVVDELDVNNNKNLCIVDDYEDLPDFVDQDASAVHGTPPPRVVPVAIDPLYVVDDYEDDGSGSDSDVVVDEVRCTPRRNASVLFNNVGAVGRVMSDVRPNHSRLSAQLFHYKLDPKPFPG
ncbi:DNA replication ATP-dependent helicase/nuclease DNA2 [Acrasis kona]|uniref:DNA replication ATP-dependent helicase/nuclease n=1 Tax=Acrasis kona TaxID=1008807 RepID=A0AAW2YVF9_9EUKA